MKRSRIICSIITAIYVLLLIAISVCLIRSNIIIKSSLKTYVKIIHIALFAMCLVMYMVIKKKLYKKTENEKLISMYKYMYLAVLVLVSRIGLFFLFKTREVMSIIPSFGDGLGSYINYVLSHILKNTMYANVVINTVLSFMVVILIKRLMFNITNSDFLSTLSSVIYIMLPTSMYYVTEYNRFTYNLLFMLIGLNMFVKIIDEVKQYKLKNNNYVYLAISLGFVIGIDILFKGSYILWCIMLIMIIPAANYIDIFHVSFGDRFKFNIKFKRLLCKIEQVNISKLVKVSAYSLGVAGVIKLILMIISSFAYTLTMPESFGLAIENSMMLSRNYYILLIFLIIIFEIIGIVLRRKIDIKMVLIKLFNIIGVLYVMFNGTSMSCIIFDTSLSLLAVCNICNIYYNMEEKIKLLKEKN